jgi:DNA invertase Pin-like site-specific DNA recombinase
VIDFLAFSRRNAGANIDTTTANGRLVFGIFAALAEFDPR